MESMAKGGDLGEIHYAYAERVNLGVVRKDENAFWSLAPHDLSMMCNHDEAPSWWPIFLESWSRRCRFLRPSFATETSVIFMFLGWTLTSIEK